MKKTNKLVLDWIENGHMPDELVTHIDAIVRFVTDSEDERQACWLKLLGQKNNIKIELLCPNYWHVICVSQCSEMRRRYVLEDIRRKKWIELCVRMED